MQNNEQVTRHDFFFAQTLNALITRSTIYDDSLIEKAYLIADLAIKYKPKRKQRFDIEKTKTKNIVTEGSTCGG